MPEYPGDGTSPTTGNVSPSTQNVVWNRVDNIPTLQDIKITSTTADFVEFYIQYENTSVQWLELTGYGQEGYIDFQGTTYAPITLKNLDQLYGSNYKATVHFRLTKPEGADLMKTVVINLSLTGSVADSIQTDKLNYNVLYRRNLNQLSGDTHVNILNNNNSANLSLDTIGTLFKELSFTSGFDLVEDPDYPFVSNPELPSTGTIVVPCRLKKDGQNIFSFTVTVVVIDSDAIVVNPDTVSFIIRKGFNERKRFSLELINPLNKIFTVEHPWWVSIDYLQGSSGDFDISTVSSEEIDPGNYNDIIQITYDSKTITIPISLQVLQFAEIDVSDYNFCLDGVRLWTNKMFENGVFARLNLKMKFETDEGISEFDSIYSIPYFNGQAKTDLGQKVQNYFPIYKKHLFEESDISFNNKLVYRPASVIVTVEELDVNYNVLHSTTLDAVKLFAGKRPLKFPFFTNFGLRRRYSGFSHIFSFYTEVVNPDHIITNESSNPVTSNDVQTAFVTNESILNMDFIGNNIGLEFLPFPKVERQVILQWLNNNLVPECMIFSGSYIIQDDFEHSVDNYQINGKKYETKEVGKITIKSGFILKEEILLLKEISKSLISFMKIGDNIYECLCTTSKLIREDSEENLVQREMEFFIVL